MTFADWKRECWCEEAARHFDVPRLTDDRIPLQVRFQLAAKRLHPGYPAQTPKVITLRFKHEP
jgi:hypothetical protein